MAKGTYFITPRTVRLSYCCFRRALKSGSESPAFKLPLRIQTIIYSQIIFLRKLHGSRLNVFAPVNDLSTLSKTGGSNRAGGLVAGPRNNVAIAGGQILGDEWSDHVVKVHHQNTVAI